MRRAAVLVGLALIAGVLGMASPASACSFVVPGPTQHELLAQADLAFEGVALSSRDPNAGAPIISSGDPIIWTFAVDRPIKGPVHRLQEVTTARSGASCGVAFQEGVRYRVLAVHQDGAFWTFLFSGTSETPAQRAHCDRGPHHGHHGTVAPRCNDG
jgi:hypothetical protein